MDYRPAMRTRTGIGRYVAGLSRALAANGCDLRLYGVFFRGNRPERREAPPGARLVSWKVPARLVNWLYLMRVCNMDGIVGGCSVFHHTDFQIPERPLRAREVLSVHDLTFMRMADSHSQRARRALTRVVYKAARRCDAFLCPSEASAQDCAEHLGVGEERTFGRLSFRIVGIFSTGGANDSEIWGAFEELGETFRRQNVVRATRLRAASPEAARELIATIRADQRLEVEPLAESEYFRLQTQESSAVFIVLGNLLDKRLIVEPVNLVELPVLRGDLERQRRRTFHPKTTSELCCARYR